MKIIPIALAANLASGAATPAYALRIVRTDNQAFGFTSATRSEPIDGLMYDAGQGLNISAIATAAGLGVDNLELTTLDDGSLFTHEDVVHGVWQGAAFLIFRYSWANPTGGVEYLTAGTIGNVTLKQGSIVAELRGLQQYLQQPVGNITSKTCRARFADHPRQLGSNRCGLASADWSNLYAVVGATSRRAFTSGVPGVPGGAVGDPEFNSVATLLAFDGASGATTFPDAGPTPISWTAVGGAQITTAFSRFGGGSLALDGAGDAIACGPAAGLNFATGDLTIEFWIRTTFNASGVSPFPRIVAPASSVNPAAGALQLWVSGGTVSGDVSANVVSWPNSTGTAMVVSTKTVFNDGNWHHIAFTRQAGTCRAFFDGELKDTAAGAFDLSVLGAEGARIGGRGDGAAWLNAQIDDMRITKGLARYTATFTPPASAFPTFGGGSASQPDDWFSEGLVTFTSGQNSGITAKVRSHLRADGAFELMTDMPREIVAGDTFTALAGCRKRLDEDCAAKFDNALNFQGEPHMPGVDQLTASVA